MAEQRMEAIQSARRKPDYDPFSDDEEHDEENDVINDFATTAKTPSMLESPHHPSAFFDPLFNESKPIHKQSTDLPVGLSTGKSLLDEVDDVSFELTPMFSRISDVAAGHNQNKPAGIAGYLEIEEEPPRGMVESPSPARPLSGGPSDDEPIRTSSGLLLTHRRTPTTSRERPPVYKQFAMNETTVDDHDNKKRNAPFLRIPQSSGFGGWPSSSPSLAGHSHYLPSGGGSIGGGRHSMAVVQAKRFMSYVRLWVILSFVLLLVATGVLIHSFHHSNDDSTPENSSQQLKQQSGQVSSTSQIENIPEQIILVPIENISEWVSAQQQQHQQQQQPIMQLGHDMHNHHFDNALRRHDESHGGRRVLLELRQEFEYWVQDHGKKYHSGHEKEHRFNIWAQNHQRTIEKNRRHGPCKLTKQHVFGSTPFKDLTQEEFKSKYLTGYKGPRVDDAHLHDKRHSKMQQFANVMGQVLDPQVHKPNVHHTVKKRMLQQKDPILTYQQPHCSWYDISCWLRWIWGNTNLSLVGIGTMEPAYDANSYPNAIDWRSLGAVTDVRYQGTCGACWAITAVETVESAHFISTGKLYELSESEIILCDSSCEMCEGGWPQNAFSWVMDHGGLPLQKSFSYDGDLLYAFTAAIAGESNSYTEDDVKAYRSQQCPDSDHDSHSGDGDREFDENGKTNEKYGDYSSSGRYGNIKGYGYATDRCVCYSDGSGCDCDKQKEGLAVRNVATYGPAVVCLEASLWQDYSGGIITSEIGCSQKFLDMNHCVQVVGYAYTDGNDEEQEDEDRNGHSGSGDKGGSKDDDDKERSGYWIVRNQWGQNWGMGGYAYVAMGENTCGILNDMAQAYL